MQCRLKTSITQTEVQVPTYFQTVPQFSKPNFLHANHLLIYSLKQKDTKCQSTAASQAAFLENIFQDLSMFSRDAQSIYCSLSCSDLTSKLQSPDLLHHLSCSVSTGHYLTDLMKLSYGLLLIKELTKEAGKAIEHRIMQTARWLKISRGITPKVFPAVKGNKDSDSKFPPVISLIHNR